MGKYFPAINILRSQEGEVSIDPFYSKSNIRYLEKIAYDVTQGQAHFAEHELAEEE